MSATHKMSDMVISADHITSGLSKDKFSATLSTPQDVLQSTDCVLPPPLYKFPNMHTDAEAFLEVKMMMMAGVVLLGFF